jgi:hypothetical protein
LGAIYYYILVANKYEHKLGQTILGTLFEGNGAPVQSQSCHMQVESFVGQWVKETNSANVQKAIDGATAVYKSHMGVGAGARTAERYEKKLEYCPEDGGKILGRSRMTGQKTIVLPR